MWMWGYNDGDPGGDGGGCGGGDGREVAAEGYST